MKFFYLCLMTSSIDGCNQKTPILLRCGEMEGRAGQSSEMLEALGTLKTHPYFSAKLMEASNCTISC